MTFRGNSSRTLVALLGVGAWALLALAVGCDTSGDDDDTTDEEGTPPEIIHEPVGDEQPAFLEVAVEATVTDADGVSAVTLYYRPAGAENWSFSYMYETEQSGQYVGVISSSVVTAQGVDYYLRAVDGGVPRGEATSPEDAPDGFHHFGVEVVGESLPFVEDWEGGTLAELGWEVVNDGFPDYDWEVTDQQALSSDNSVMHGEGINDIAGLKDWLISPVLEFDGESEVAVHWGEYGMFTADTQVHQLYLSMGSPDPSSGDFQLVSDLPAPAPDVWVDSLLYDITDLVSEGEGYVAFYYEGEYPADRWFIDDVYVGEPLPRFELGDVTADPADFEPGAAVDLTITVDNVSLVDSLPVTGTLQSSDTLLEMTVGSVEYGVVESGGSASGDGPFTVTVDAEHPHNISLPFTLTLDDGEHSWDLEFELLMGSDSSATIEYDATTALEVYLSIGHGDPAAPSYEVTTEVGDAGSWQVDITSEAWFLPPGPADRWWIRVNNDGLYAATINGFRIDWGDVAFESEQVPFEVLAQSEALLYLPPLAELEATAVVADPDPISPGDAGVLMTVEVTNVGVVETAGSLLGTLSSTDPDVSNILGVDLSFGADPLGPGDSAINGAPFSFDVDAGHVDDSELEFTLALTDGVDSYEVAVAIPVPHAHVELEDLVVDDSSGNGDGIIDRGETVSLTAAFRNTGDFDTAGDVSATLAMAASSMAEITVIDGDEALGAPIPAGEPLVAPDAFEMSIDTGYLGDLVILDVTLTDGVDTWLQTFEMEVSERPWQAIPGATDSVGDSNGYMFDIDQMWFKTDGEVLWLRTDSYSPFDTSTLWMTYVFYDVPKWWRVEFIYSEFKIYDDWFDGWFSGDEVTPTLPMEWYEEQDGPRYSFVWRILLEDMEVDGHSLRIGMFAGSCPFIYYCDTAHDSWFYLDLQNAVYGQSEEYLYVFTW